MKQGAILIAAMLMLAAQVALAQAPPPPDTTSIQQTQTPPAAPAPMPAAAPAPPPSPQHTASASRPQVYRYGSLSGSWLLPSGDFDKVANDGWAITLEGYQYVVPTKKIAVGSQVGYQSFAKKNGVAVSNFPVDAVLKFYPKPGSGKADLYGTGGLGFNYMRTEVGHASSTDYFFGTQAGAGVDLHTSGPLSIVVDAVYHWIFSSGTDSNFIALRAGLLVPMMR